MSNYAERNLNNGEKIVLKAKRSFWALLPAIIWCVVFLIIVIIVTSVMGKKLNEAAADKSITEDTIQALANTKKIVKVVNIIMWVLWALIGVLPVIIKAISLACTCLCITNKRVIGKTGALSVHTLDYPINKVDNVEINAGLFGRIFHYYTVSVRGSGGDNAQIKFVGISNAPQFKNNITEAVERHAEEARRAQAEEIARAMSNK